MFTLTNIYTGLCLLIMLKLYWKTIIQLRQKYVLYYGIVIHVMRGRNFGIRKTLVKAKESVHVQKRCVKATHYMTELSRIFDEP